MGKYMRTATKTTTRDEVEVMDLSLGVRTRAKTLALQRQPPLPPPPPATSAGYLQLRSRRLVKPPVLEHYPKRQKHGRHNKVSGRDPAGSGPRRSGQVGKVNRGNDGGEVEVNNSNEGGGNDESKGLGVEIEASFGENFFDTDGRERTTRESTPCNLIRDPETVLTPCSTTKPTSSSETNRKIRNSLRRHIPTAVEMDEFFARAEQEQQKQFVKKYNFDPVNDKPLPGNYKWEKLDP